ncbi:porin [Shewanella sp. NIFS-20-20]|uniref:porin n=1 Tax=Shewanella sp. NIFS-20-20 TaxID=2853806 RepID=UPI001C4745A0|nr:porin [Shewanella sp. NIFS-20-20]MBV7317563.1 porin [Shewanella sp. NIFS-20-20]
MKLFTKTLIASALTSLTLASAQAADPITVYGKLNVTAQYDDINGDSTNTIQSNASRFGVKGAYEISSDLEAFYTIEYEVDTGSDSSDNFKARNQFIGLRGDFGALSVGRNDTLLKVSQGKIDQFNDLSGDMKNLFKGDNRMAQTATYLTPSLSGLTLGVTYVAQDDAAQMDKNGFSVAAMYGDSKLKSTPIYAAIAYDSEVKGYDILRASVQGKVAGLLLGGIYQQQEKSDNGKNKNGYLFSAAYDISAVTLKAQYQDMEDLGKSWSAGADYKLAKPTKLLMFYTDRSYDVALRDNDKYLGVGIEHKF